MDETYLVEAMKDAAAFFSVDMQADLAAARAGAHRAEYVLPDGVTHIGRGHLRAPSQPLPRGKPQPKEQVCYFRLRL